jgi:hypothetical protein
MGKSEKVKKSIWIFMICIIAIALSVTALIVFRDSLFKRQVSFDSDIVIKRTDDQEPLKMPYKYSEIFLTIRSRFEEEIVNLKMSSASYDIGETGIKWGAVENVLVNTGDKNALEILGNIKYCKGITDTSTITSEKKKSSVIFYEGYTAELLMDKSSDYVIIPSSMSKYINEEFAAEDKIMTLKQSIGGYMGMYTIIGEYTTKDEYDTIYVSYAGLGKLIESAQLDMSEYVESLEIDVDEEKDLTKLVEYLGRYFMDANVPEQYEGKTNKFDDPYLYKFVHSINTDPMISETPIETVTEPSPSQGTQPETENENNIITISRIDKNDDLQMSHDYADALIRDYKTYSKYIDDIVISTGIFGVDTRLSTPHNPIIPYGISDGCNSEFFNNLENGFQDMSDIIYHQAVTSISEIKEMKSDCEITFYGDYTNQDLVVPRTEDCVGFVKGYCIIPASLNEASKNKDKLVEYDYNIFLGFIGNTAERFYNCGFKIIGHYVTTDEYDTVYVTYTGFNGKYEFEPYNSEYTESIVIETNKDMDITPFIEYLERYFAPADNTEEFEGMNNELGIEYEFCYTRSKSTD